MIWALLCFLLHFWENSTISRTFPESHLRLKHAAALTWLFAIEKWLCHRLVILCLCISAAFKIEWSFFEKSWDYYYYYPFLNSAIKAWCHYGCSSGQMETVALCKQRMRCFCKESIVPKDRQNGVVGICYRFLWWLEMRVRGNEWGSCFKLTLF